MSVGSVGLKLDFWSDKGFLYVLLHFLVAHFLCCAIQFLVDFAVAVYVLYIGFHMLSVTDSKEDLLLNAVALRYVIDTDDRCGELAKNIGVQV